MRPLSLFFFLTTFVSAIYAQKADFSKMSPLIRQMAVSARVNETKAKSVERTRQDEKGVVAFVRCDGTDVIEREGCTIYATFDDIHIVRIPLSRIGTLSLLPEIKRIEAGKSCRIMVDTTRFIVNADKVHEGRGVGGSLNSKRFTGRNVIIGVQDICFDLTHPTFWSSGGKEYRIKALWDQLAQREEGHSALPVGKEIVGKENLFAYRHSADWSIDFHGTHTSAIAGGSGWNGRIDSPYKGIAPDADLCLVCNYSGDNKEVVDEEDLDLYTDATDILGFKYIFDYAERQGKPCVINFSEGRVEDFYGETMYYEAVEKLLGPGRILCASAGNLGSCKTYLHKNAGEDRLSTFIYAWGGMSEIFMRADREYRLSLDFIYGNGEKHTQTYSFEDVMQAEDETINDTIEVKGREYQIVYCVYPSGLNENEWGAELYLTKLGGGSIGSEPYVMLSFDSGEADIEVYSIIGELKSNTALCPESRTAETGHLIFFPSASKNVISVGSVTYSRTLNDYKGMPITFSSDSEGEKSYFSCMGPTIQGFVKPDVVAPGENIISAKSTFYHTEHPDDNPHADVERFEYDGCTYAWTALSGTSMSTPVVTGVIALWLQACPTLTPEKVIDVFSHTSRRRPDMTYPNNMYGWGEIDAEAGLEYILSEYCGITETESSRQRIQQGAMRYYDANGRRIRSIEGLHGLFIAISENGAVTKIVR